MAEAQGLLPGRGTPVSSSRLRQQQRSAQSSRVAGMQGWEFPGWGDDVVLEPLSPNTLQARRSVASAAPRHEQLGEFAATAICGNDILSSCLYTTGLVTVSAGKLAPFVMLTVGVILYLFRSIYGEAITTIRQNGGSYSVLLNSTSKSVAAFSATLALLSYCATAVTSATSAASYFRELVPDADVVQGGTLLLVAFALLCLTGLRDSARVAMLLFSVHLLTLVGLCLIGGAYAVAGPSRLAENWATDLPRVDVVGSRDSGSVFHALFFGLGSAMLGVSGFESSAQFVEEQAPGVFVKTLRNMWVGVAFFNPVLSLLAMCVLPVAEIAANRDTVMVELAHEAAGFFFGERVGDVAGKMVSVDAVVVLAGAVLTAYVGVLGLSRRLAGDKCLPSLLLDRNERYGTNHWIILGFCAVAVTLLHVLNGDVGSLGGVYAIAFLGVMLSLCVGLALLKVKRPGFRRQVTCPWSHLLWGGAGVSAGIAANLLGKAEVVVYFLVYWLSVAFVVFLMFQRVQLLRVVLHAVRHGLGTKAQWAESAIKALSSAPIVFFAKTADLYLLNKAVCYIRSNESTMNIVIAHVSAGEDAVPAELAEHVALIDALYPKVRCHLLVAHVESGFGPEAIGIIAERLHVPLNSLFVASSDRFSVEELGGVRVITS